MSRDARLFFNRSRSCPASRGSRLKRQVSMNQLLVTALAIFVALVLLVQPDQDVSRSHAVVEEVAKDDTPVAPMFDSATNSVEEGDEPSASDDLGRHVVDLVTRTPIRIRRR